MAQPKTHFQEKLDDINELLGYYVHSTKGETLAAQRGLLQGWLARIAATDYIVANELKERLYLAKHGQKPSKGTS
jgi:hypothetical protein